LKKAQFLLNGRKPLIKQQQPVLQENNLIEIKTKNSKPIQVLSF
jgi:hypothetical protein